MASTQTNTELLAPPKFEINKVNLVSTKDSKIINVSVYSGRAELTRLFKFAVKTGQNQVGITGLPNVLEEESFKVEGQGAATIHDVTISTIRPPPKPTTSAYLDSLLRTKEKIQKALERAKKSIGSLEIYLQTPNAQNVDVSKLENIVRGYEVVAEKLDTRVIDLQAELEEVEEAVKKERESLATATDYNEKLNLKATIGVFADDEEEVEIALIYAVRRATWNAGYDIRVNMDSKEKPVTLIYKGAITQSTGEDWTDVPLTLETAAPTFGLSLPSLRPWKLSVHRALAQSFAIPYSDTRSMVPPQDPRLHQSHTATRSSRLSGPGGPRAMMALPEMEVSQMAVSSGAGGMSATFDVPGLISVPSDGVAHNVTIVQLGLDAMMSWISVPKVDPKTHLNAIVKNASEYTLLPGSASIYVDRSFISRTALPLVSPEESFPCPLGLDASIRITYHPRVKKVSQSGFYSKSTTYIYEQRITVYNTKSTAVDRVKIVEQVPISEDETVTVKLVNPPLTLPSSDATASGALKIPSPVKVSPGVTAQWAGADEGQGEIDVVALGKDGRFNWICQVPAQGKLILALQWEVTAPAGTEITGLNLS